ncbi:alpha/beta fold hydrolase [Streptomyces sp. Amel2xC10]|uniref:alpha/beta fold hydrolase n=1 Tax=Streptomyces sp. Amel2xC10 TaxID=1305826 RepID=UPI000A08FD6F|nr:alpha/beta hydrolase [Streptomyces sp. Amel2xC10]SMF44507.1 Pimeloyl-ACP methyl ester carboxylesterase [Streptomyces sp. Amel2xC10]
MPNITAPDGTRLAYHVIGKDDGESDPLVVLPGGPMRASRYLGDLGGLAERRRLVLLDLRGTGDSEVPADPASYRCDRQVEDVEALRLHLGLERMDLLAHSAGGSLATLYAARYPERVARLALVTVIPWVIGEPATAEDRLEAAQLRAEEPWFADAFPALTAWLAGEGEPDWDLLSAFFYGRWDAAARAHDAAAEEESNDEAGERFHDPAAFDPPALRGALERLTAPVLVLAGELDGGPTPALARRLATVFPNAESVVQPGAGHYPWLDDPEWFAGRIGVFFGTVASRE